MFGFKLAVGATALLLIERVAAFALDALAVVNGAM